MDSKTIIAVESVSKSFKLPHEKQSSLKGLVTSLGSRKKTFEIQKALKNISFDVKEGEFFGIVGRNGSGKSTLLKLIAGIYTPDKGQIKISGRLIPFIELGVGFSPDLTGRENVYLNGALLGFSRKEMSAMYQDIVDFAELEKFMDQKLKNYSSGMQVRLAFSIAIRAKGDILVLDEVLAVGDEAFQQKCIDVFESHKANKQTIVLVTHDMSMVRRFCSRAMLINNGVIESIGSPEQIASKYSQLNDDSSSGVVEKNNQNQGKYITARLLDADNKQTTTFTTGDVLRVAISWPDSTKGVRNIGVGIVKNSGEFVSGVNTFGTKTSLKGNQLFYEIKLPLGPGKYTTMIGLFGDTEKEVIDFWDNGPQFIVKGQRGDKAQGIIRIPHRWDTR
jgi:ABC-2 type transport system ATP-binding protein